MTSDLPIRADELSRTAAALAEHLQRCGVQWLPAPNAGSVAAIAARFTQPTSAAAASTVESAANSGKSAARSDPARPPISPAEPAAPAAVRSAADKAPAGQTPERQTAKRLAPAASINAVGDSYPGDPLPLAQRESELASMSAEVAGCTRCNILAQCRKNTVFGEGHAAPRVVFFGEGPGADEDRTGRPFVGRAGELLTKMIEACTLARQDTYILNTVKCRPPQNRNPEPGEIENCREYFERQFKILRPEYIVCLGAISSQTLLQSKLSVGRLRGRLHQYFDSKVLVTYHPAYLLRNPAAKKAAWDDLQLMLRDAGIDPKSRAR